MSAVMGPLAGCHTYRPAVACQSTPMRPSAAQRLCRQRVSGLAPPRTHFRQSPLQPQTHQLQQQQQRRTTDTIVPQSSLAIGSTGTPEQPAAPKPAAAAPQKGVKVVPALLSIAVGLAIRFLIPIPAGIEAQAWTLLSIFVTAIVGLVLEPLAVGAWAMCCLTAVLATGSMPFPNVMSGTVNEVIWMIVISFFFAKGFDKTGLGERIANIFVAAFGKSSLGLTYGLTFAELMMAPALPSTTARAGGIFMPIIRFLSKTAGSDPAQGTAARLGTFLVLCQMHCSTYSGAFFLTGAAQNLLCLKIAQDMGVPITNAFTTWAYGACVPSLFGVIIVPLIIYKLLPPELKQTPEAPAAAQERLNEMGPMSTQQRIMLAILAVAVGLWVFGEAIGVSAVVGAMVALGGLLVTGVLEWQDCLEFSTAWDTLVWFSILVGMSGGMQQYGLIDLLAKSMNGALAGFSLHWTQAFGLLHAAFFAIHYLFASQVAHVGALYAAFLAMMTGAGVPPLLAALSLGYNVNAFASLTHYASGGAVVYFTSGFVGLKQVLPFGAIMGVISMIVYGTVGMAWWKLIGWW